MNISVRLSSLPVRLRFERPLTEQELLKFCARNDLLRIEQNEKGDLEIMSPSGSEGGAIEARVVFELTLWSRSENRGTTTGPSGGFRLPDTSVRAPDAAWVSWQRWNSVTAEQRDGYAPMSPDFVIEVRSQSDRLKKLQAKMTMWLNNGVELGWLIDPKRKVVEIYRPGEAAEVHENPTSVQGSGPVAGFELVLEQVWGDPQAA